MDRRLQAGCGDNDEVDGWLAFHPFVLGEMGFVDIITIDADSSNVELGDIRNYGDVVKVPVPGETGEYFLISNHQNSGPDTLLGGRGAAIWHIRESAMDNDYVCPESGSSLHIIDLEHHSGRFEHTNLCADRPLVADPAAGVDSLDCKTEMLPSALYPGVVAGGAFTYDFTKDTNPTSNKYGSSADNRHDSQSDTSGVYIEDMEAVADGSYPGKYLIRFDVSFK